MATLKYTINETGQPLELQLQSKATDYWIIAATGAGESYNPTHEADYNHSPSEPGKPGQYIFTISDAVANGFYNAYIYCNGVLKASGLVRFDGNKWVAVDEDSADAKAAAEATLATMPSAATVAETVWSYGSRTLSSFGTLVATIAAAVWASTVRTLTGSALGLGPTAQRSKTEGKYKCFQGGTEALGRLILGWDGSPLKQADVLSITYSIYELSSDDPPERTVVDGHDNISLDKTAVLFDEVRSDAWASDYNFKHIPEISTNAAFAEAGTDCLVEYTITPTSGEKWIERIKVEVV